MEMLRHSVDNRIRFPFSTVSIHESNNLVFPENIVTEIRLPISKLVISIARLPNRNATITRLHALEESLSFSIPSFGTVIYL